MKFFDFFSYLEKFEFTRLFSLTVATLFEYARRLWGDCADAQLYPCLLCAQLLLVSNSPVLAKKKITVIVYLQTPRVFHSLMVLSLDPETICLLSAEKATLMTSLVWPLNCLVVLDLKPYLYLST